jgi:hypothetical protein
LTGLEDTGIKRLLQLLALLYSNHTMASFRTIFLLLVTAVTMAVAVPTADAMTDVDFHTFVQDGIVWRTINATEATVSNSPKFIHKRLADYQLVHDRASV